MSINDQLRDFKNDYQLDYEALSEILLFSAAALRAWIEGKKHSPSGEMTIWIEKKIQTYRRNQLPPEREKKAEKQWPRGINPKRIKRFLIVYRWTTEDLANELGVSEGTVKRWLIGSFVPQRRFQQKLLKLLRYGPKVPSQQELVDIVTTSINLLPPMTPNDVIDMCKNLKKGRQRVIPVPVSV